MIINCSDFIFFSHNNNAFRLFHLFGCKTDIKNTARYIDKNFNIYPVIQLTKRSICGTLVFGTFTQSNTYVIIRKDKGMYTTTVSAIEAINRIKNSFDTIDISDLIEKGQLLKVSPEIMFNSGNPRHINVFAHMLHCSLPMKLPTIAEHQTQKYNPGITMAMTFLTPPPSKQNTKSSSSDSKAQKISLSTAQIKPAHSFNYISQPLRSCGKDACFSFLSGEPQSSSGSESSQLFSSLSPADKAIGINSSYEESEQSSYGYLDLKDALDKTSQQTHSLCGALPSIPSSAQKHVHSVACPDDKRMAVFIPSLSPKKQAKLRQSKEASFHTSASKNSMK